MALKKNPNVDTIYTLIYQNNLNYIAEVSVNRRETVPERVITAESTFNVSKISLPTSIEKAPLTRLSGVTISPLVVKSSGVYSNPPEDRLYAVDEQSRGLFTVDFPPPAGTPRGTQSSLLPSYVSQYGEEHTDLRPSLPTDKSPLLIQIKALAFTARTIVASNETYIALFGITEKGDIWFCLQNPNNYSNSTIQRDTIYQATLVKANPSYQTTNITVDKDYLCILQEGSTDKRIRFISMEKLLNAITSAPTTSELTTSWRTLQTLIDNAKLPETYVTLPSDLLSIRLSVIDEVLYVMGITDPNIKLFLARLKNAYPGEKTIDYQAVICNTKMCGMPLGIVGNDKIAAIAFQNPDPSADSYGSKPNRGNVFLFPPFDKNKLITGYYNKNRPAVHNVALTYAPYNIGILNSNIYLGIKNEGKLGFARLTLPANFNPDMTLDPTYFFSKISADLILDSIVVL